MRTNLPDKNYFLNKPIPELPQYIIIEYVNSGMNGHLFKAYNEKVNNYYTCKVIPKTNLIAYEQNPEQWKEEVLKANRLEIDTVVKYFHVAEWADKINKIDCVVLCASFIKGDNLDKYIRKHKNGISISFIEEFLKEMFDFLNEMVQKTETHGDLHERNILVEKSSSLRGQPYRFRVTDFGVGSKTSNPSVKDDYEQIAIILRRLLENTDYQKCDSRDRYLFNILNNDFLARHLTEKDTTHDPLARNPSELFNKLININEELRLHGAANNLNITMSSPFDYPSLEQFGDSYQLLKELYSELFLGLDKIEQKYNLILTGPRGCGKSTSFKSLSLLYKIRVATRDLSNVAYLGIYYRCDDLYFAFPRYQQPSREGALDLPIHFLTASLLIEVLKTIEEFSVKEFSNEWKKNESILSREIWNILNLKKPDDPSAESFRSIINELNKERIRAVSKQRVAHDPKQTWGYYFGAEILVKVCEKINRMLLFLNSLPFFFFIDDYSMPKISLDLQKNLNRLLMQRTAFCFFKIATESPVSYVPNDIDGKNYVEGREFELLNLGIEYIHADRKQKLQFIEDIFFRRFKAIPHYPVSSLETLLGKSPSESHNAVALNIRRKKKPTLKGKDVLCDLCSGDIHYIISLVGNMVQNVGGKEGLLKLGSKPIGVDIQNKAIRDEAGNFLKNLIRLPGGERLAKIVNVFGSVAHYYLLTKDSRNEDLNPPHQASRIEPLEQPTLSLEAEKIYNELLRYSVFIEDLRGKSRRGDIVPRLYLRRFLIPYFNLTFSTRDSIQVDSKQFEMLLLRPQEFEITMTKNKIFNEGQTDLFNN